MRVLPARRARLPAGAHGDLRGRRRPVRMTAPGGGAASRRVALARRVVGLRLVHAGASLERGLAISEAVDPDYPQYQKTLIDRVSFRGPQ